MFRIACLAIGYALGCIQSAYFIGRSTRNIDIREHGSKSAGFTNANRVMGFKLGIVIFIIDVAKAILAFIIASMLFDGTGSFLPAGELSLLPGIWAGLGAVLGHCFPFFMKFKGGKGIACILGLMIMLDWRAAVVIFIVAAILLVFTRFISTSSLLISLLMPISMAVLGYGAEVVTVAAVISALAWFMHRANIGRLIAGTENKFSFTKKDPASTSTGAQ